MNFGLTKTQQLFQQMIREFAEKEVKPLAAEVDDTERFPMETVEKMAKLGLFGIYIPKNYGGAGGDHIMYSIAVEELSRVCATTGVILSAHTSLCMSPIWEFGTEEQKQKYLPKLASGEWIGAFGLTEPNAGTDAAGGITFINHPGDFIAANKENGRAEDYNQLKVFIDPLMKYDSCVGIEIFNLRDTTDRADRILWDSILQYTIPQGKNVWGFANDDSHALDDIDVTRDVMLMPELSNEALRTAMENGTFFSVSHYSNGVELNGMEEMPGFVEQNVYDTKSFWLDNTPNVSRITVDEENDTITVEASNANIITWVSNGNVILREELVDGKATLDLHSDKLLNDPYLYVRFYVSGDNGICYAQPMVLNVKGETFAPVDVPETHDISTFLRGLVTVVDLAFFRLNPIIWVFKYFALGYNPITLERIFNPF